MEVGRLKEVREAYGITQKDLAEKLGVSFASVKRWERGHTKPSNLSLERIQQFYKDLSSFPKGDCLKFCPRYCRDKVCRLDYSMKCGRVACRIERQGINRRTGSGGN